MGMDDAAQAFLKSKIQDNITKYYMLIVFTGYLNDIEAPKPNTAEEDIKLSKSFTDFYGNLGKIIHDILGAGNKIYRDMADVGDHKKRAKYRFSSKTLMSLLPPDDLKKIEDKVERGEMTVDFYDILGEVQKDKK